MKLQESVAGDVMPDILQWFFTIGGFVLGVAGLFIGIWDLRIDMRDLKQDANSLQLKDDDEK
jgi:hypothetical protein